MTIRYPKPVEDMAAANGMTVEDFERQTAVMFALPTAAMVGKIEGDWRRAADRLTAQLAEDGWEIRRRG
jgi:hypothetical protein